MKVTHPWKEIAENGLRVGLHGTGWLLSCAGGLLQAGGSQLHSLAQRLAVIRPK